jgi:hypothetical protein
MRAVNTNRATRIPIATITLALLSLAAVHTHAADGGAVVINAGFPGGNVTVSQDKGSIVNVAPDPRGDKPWFYWYFEAKASKPGRVTFVFPEKVVGFKNGAIGFQGPAISTNLGKTWKWMGTDNVDGSSFFFDFAKINERVRFAVTIPYVQTELDEFLRANTSNPHLKTSVLTKSRHGRDVELLQIGIPGGNRHVNGTRVGAELGPTWVRS